MPETEPKPRLIELLGSGAGAGWRATLRDGRQAVVHEIQVPQAEAAAAVPRLQRLYEHRHPALSPVLAWGTDNSGVWIAVDPNDGTPLGSILTRGPLTPPAAAALGAAVLSGVAALHEAGIAMGGFNASAVRVTSNGDVRLAGHPAAAVRGAPSQSDLRADVRSCGMAVCAAFGVDPAGAPAPPNIPPGLVVTMRSMASGAMGPSADRAQSALREMASALLAPDRQVAAQTELATRSGGREVPPITPFLPKQEGVAPAAAPAPAPAPPIVRPQAPAPYAQPPARQSGIYEAPDRPVQTYPKMPAYRPEPAPTTPPVPPEAPRTSPPPPAVPTWADAPPRPATPAEPTPAARSTTPPVPAPPVEPPARRSPFEGVSSPTTPPAPAPAPPPAPSWTPAAPPAWELAEVAPPAAPSVGSTAPPPATKPPAPAIPTPPPLPPVPAPTPPPMPARKPPVARPPYGREPSERPGWLIPAAVAGVVVILLGIGGVVLVNSRSTSGGPGPTAHATPSKKPTASPPKGSPSASPTGQAPLAVPNTFGPASAAPLTKIQFCTTATPCPIQQGTPAETATACDLNSCFIEVALYFSSGQKVPVKYDLKFFDRCSGLTTDLPGPSPYTPPGYAVVIPRDHWQVNIPSGVKSGALIAVASQPTTAASQPLLLGSETTC